MHFRILSSLSFQRKTKRHVFLLLFVLTPVHLNWPSYATGKCNQSPRQLISTMKHWWLYITINSLTIFKWKMRNLRLNLIYLSFFVQYISFRRIKLSVIPRLCTKLMPFLDILRERIEQGFTIFMLQSRPYIFGFLTEFCYQESTERMPIA